MREKMPGLYTGEREFNVAIGAEIKWARTVKCCLRIEDKAISPVECLTAFKIHIWISYFTLNIF